MQIELTAWELRILWTAVGNSTANSVRDYRARAQLMDWLDFTAEERVIVGYQSQLVNGSDQTRFNPTALVVREFSEGQRLNCIRILEQGIGTLRVAAHAGVLSALEKLGYVPNLELAETSEAIPCQN